MDSLLAVRVYELLRQGRLGKMEPLGGASKMKFFGYGSKVAKMAEFDFLIHM